jgi:uncharacterized protein (TIGR00369 family)
VAARLSDEAAAARNEELRARFRHIYQDEVPFNGLIGMEITRWDPDGVRFEVPFRDELASHAETFHGGVLSTLIDAAAGGAVLAGHDFANGSRLSTVGMTVHYLSAAPQEDLVAEAVCTRRGRNLNYVHVDVVSSESRKPLAEGLVTCNMTSRTRESRRDDRDDDVAAAGTPAPAAAGAAVACRRYLDCINEGRYAAVADLFAADAEFLAPDGSTVRGRDAIRSFYTSALDVIRPRRVWARTLVADEHYAVMEIAAELSDEDAEREHVVVDHFTVDDGGMVTRMAVYLRPDEVDSTRARLAQS